MEWKVRPYPKDDRDVLVRWWDPVDEVHRRSIGFWDSLNWFVYEYPKPVEATHWMELPAHPN